MAASRSASSRGQKSEVLWLKIQVFHEDQRGIVRGGAEAADTEAFALELLEVGDAGPGKNDLIIARLDGGDEHEIKPRQIGLHHCADVDDRGIAACQCLSGDLTTTQENRFDFQTVLLK